MTVRKEWQRIFVSSPDSSSSSAAVKKHVEALLELQSLFLKKAFFKGCEFATLFILEVTCFEKA